MPLAPQVPAIHLIKVLPLQEDKVPFVAKVPMTMSSISKNPQHKVSVPLPSNTSHAELTKQTTKH